MKKQLWANALTCGGGASRGVSGVGRKERLLLASLLRELILESFNLRFYCEILCLFSCFFFFPVIVLLFTGYIVWDQTECLGPTICFGVFFGVFFCVCVNCHFFVCVNFPFFLRVLKISRSTLDFGKTLEEILFF